MERLIAPILISILLSACTSQSTNKTREVDRAPTHVPIDVMAVPDAIPKYEKRTRAGNPVEYKILGKRYKILADSNNFKERGVASWYGAKFHGRKTSNGEIYNMYAMTAAHKTLPIPSYVRVTNIKNQRSIIVRINDRGPFHGNRIIDLSYTAAAKLDILKSGVGQVEIVGIEPGLTETIVETIPQRSQKKKSFPAHLQIGAFTKWENAKYLEKKLISGQVTKSTIQIVYNKAEDLYKVQVGPLHSNDQTTQLNKKLTRLGLSGTRRFAE